MCYGDLSLSVAWILMWIEVSQWRACWVRVRRMTASQMGIIRKQLHSLLIPKAVVVVYGDHGRSGNRLSSHPTENSALLLLC